MVLGFPINPNNHKRLIGTVISSFSRISELGEDALKWPSLLAKDAPMALSLSHIHASANKSGGSHRMLSQDRDCLQIFDALEDGALAGKPVILEGPLEEATVKALLDELFLITH
ncbi:MAG TPA: hypothetical protein PLV89_10615 [Treponemataceae bacterium]|nr:hypothetical protein [Treponemataceae bacterium]